MTNTFELVHNCVTQFPRQLVVAYTQDMAELQMALAACASLGPGAAEAAAAMIASKSPLVAAAFADGSEKFVEIGGIMLWLSQSRDSEERLRDRQHSWADLCEEAFELGEEMRALKARGSSNMWSGESKRAWETFADRQLSQHGEFSDISTAVPTAIGQLGSLTTALLMQFHASAEASLKIAEGAANVAPNPSPFNLAMAMRTIGVAAAFKACQAQFLAHQFGSWRGAAAGIAGELSTTGQAMASSSMR